MRELGCGSPVSAQRRRPGPRQPVPPDLATPLRGAQRHAAGTLAVQLLQPRRTPAQRVRRADPRRQRARPRGKNVRAGAHARAVLQTPVEACDNAPRQHPQLAADGTGQDSGSASHPRAEGREPSRRSRPSARRHQGALERVDVAARRRRGVPWRAAARRRRRGHHTGHSRREVRTDQERPLRGPTELRALRPAAESATRASSSSTYWLA